MRIISKNTTSFNHPKCVLMDDQYLQIMERTFDNISFVNEIKTNDIFKLIKEDKTEMIINGGMVPIGLINVKKILVVNGDGNIILNEYLITYTNLGLKRKCILDESSSSKKKKFIDVNQIVFPKYWVPQKDVVEIFDVPIGSDEYCDVLCDFLNELFYYNAKVIKLIRVQNIQLYKWYYLRFKDIKYKLHGIKKNIEKRLYHGTTNNAIPGITHGGLDNRLSKFSGANGAGVYFATSPITSLHYLDIEDDSLKMLICKVLTGRPEKGAKNLTRPPLIRNSKERADSVKAELGHDKTFTIYDTYQSYPEYIVEFAIDKTKVNIPKSKSISSSSQSNISEELLKDILDNNYLKYHPLNEILSKKYDEYNPDINLKNVNTFKSDITHAVTPYVNI